MLEASKKSKSVIPCFFFDPRQLTPHPYRSETGLHFLFNSLVELDEELQKLGSQLHCFHSMPEKAIATLISECGVNAIFCSRDYTPFSRKRDDILSRECNKLGVQFQSLPNLLLNEPENIRSKSGTPYTVFTFFAKSAALNIVAKPLEKIPDNLARIKYDSIPEAFSIRQAKERYLTTEIPGLFVKGGRKEALTLITGIKKLADYNEARNFPAKEATTGLSAHNKFGTISIREFYHKISTSFGAGHTLCNELYWRDFFTHIGFNFPHVFEGAFNSKYDKVEWEENDEFLEAWQQGQTGFPIVDAGMRELNSSGFMHNRVRMIVASFLTKDLLLDWHHGERYFARKLLDYDPAVNNGNWQWAASTGCDAQPYFRIFNPWLQGEKFDKEAVYIKRWVPELSDLPAKKIHRLYDPGAVRPKTYPAPIVEHSEQRIKAQRMFEMIK